MSDNDAPLSGTIPYAVGQASVVRIPVPGTSGLCIELRPRGKVPVGGSTSTLFIQDIAGKRQLRLDYGYNVKTKSIDFHWNQKGTYSQFNIVDHTTVGPVGRLAYRSAKYFRYAGRTLLVVGAVLDIVSIVRASNPLRRASEVVAGWAAAWLGCKLVGAGGAALGTSFPGLGTAAGGVIGCVAGGFLGYAGGTIAADAVYDWAEGTRFEPLPQVGAPP